MLWIMGFEIKSRTLVALAAAVATIELLELMDRARPDFVVKYVRTNTSQAMPNDLFSFTDNGS